MQTLVALLVVVALGVLVLGSGPWRRVRLASRLLALLGLAGFGLVALASLYGMFALGDKGAGVLLFVAIPAAIIAGLFAFALWSSIGTEATLAAPPADGPARADAGIDGEIARLQQRVVATRARCGRWWVTRRRRRMLEESIARDQRMLADLRALQAMRPPAAPARDA